MDDEARKTMQDFVDGYDKVTVDGHRITLDIGAGKPNNTQLARRVQDALNAMQEAMQEMTEGYQQMVVLWDGNGSPPLKSSHESIEFFKQLGYIQKGIDGLNDIMNEISQLRMF